MGHATVQVWKSRRSQQDSIIPLWFGGFFLRPAFFCRLSLPSLFLLLALMQWTACRMSCHSVLIKGDGDLNQRSTHIHPIKPSWRGFLDQNSIVSTARRFWVQFCTSLFGELPPGLTDTNLFLKRPLNSSPWPSWGSAAELARTATGPRHGPTGLQPAITLALETFTLTLNKGENKVTTPQITPASYQHLTVSAVPPRLSAFVRAGSQLCPHPFRSPAFLVHRPTFPLHPPLAFEPRVCLNHLPPPFPLLTSQSDLWLSSMNLSAVFRATFHWA